jgi:hypothetical protein
MRCYFSVLIQPLFVIEENRILYNIFKYIQLILDKQISMLYSNVDEVILWKELK